MKRLLRLCSNRKSRRELLSTSEASWATTKSVGMWSREHRDDRRRRSGGSFPPHALCSWSCTPQTHGGPMQHPHEVDMVLAVLDTREIMVYGRDPRLPLRADGEAVPTAVARVP